MSKRFEHIAGAYGVSGRFLWPIQETIAVRPSVDLPPTGGFAKVHEKDYAFHQMLSFRSAYTEVSGSPNVEEVDGKKLNAENNLSLTVVDDFNLLHVIEIEKLVSRITTRAFEGTKDIEIVLTGTRFEGFKILGIECKVKLATDLFLHHPTIPSIGDAHKENKNGFRDRFNNLTGTKELNFSPNGELFCTIVEKITPVEPTTEFTIERNVIDIPHIGKLYLGELTMCKTYKQLNMVRWELGCPSGGDGTVGGGQGGGTNPW
jgi:hypothetical protein